MKYKSEIFDKLQFLFEVYKFNDHQLHCIIDFEDKINKELLKKAVMLSLDIIPILGSAYVENKGVPYWKKKDASIYKDVIIYVNNEEEFNSFITSRTDEFTGPQVKACLFSADTDSLAIIMNHMVCDAAGFKQYIYLLSDLYSKLVKNPNHLPYYKLDGDRSINRIIKQFRFKDRTKVFLLEKNRCNQAGKYKFPMFGEDEIKPYIVTHRISENRYVKIKDYSKKLNVTINDVVLAAYYRVMFNMLDINEGNSLNIPIMVDMRKHLNDRNVDSLCNLTSTVDTCIKYNNKDNFSDTVMKVNKYMADKKSNYLGLEGFIRISMASSILSYKAYKKIMRFGFKNPLIAMTNIGILDSQKLIFQGVEIKDAFMCGSIKYTPYFQLALSSYEESMTFSVNLYGSLKDKENIEHFLFLLEKELT